MKKTSPKNQRKKGIICTIISIPILFIIPILGILLLIAGPTIYFKNRDK